jgi:ABC-type antimicrobial peptide transport system permease subunit
MALGAQPGSVVKLILRYGGKLAGIGFVVGSIIALGAAQLLKSILYQVSPFDPLSFALVALLLSTIGLLACWAPARNATRINPIEALRAD